MSLLEFMAAAAYCRVHHASALASTRRASRFPTRRLTWTTGALAHHQPSLMMPRLQWVFGMRYLQVYEEV